MTKIQILENSTLKNKFEVNIQIKNKNYTRTIYNPINNEKEELLEYYFEEYINRPYDDVIIQPVPDIIKNYGEELFQQIFNGEVYDVFQQLEAKDIILEVVGETPSFQSIHWEALKEKDVEPLAKQGVIFRRRSHQKDFPKTLKVAPSPTINLLVVTARPNEGKDINHRTVQRPLIELIDDANAKVNVHILRPGTYYSLIEHLKVKKGYYHIIHFDLHGGLLDYGRYKTYFKRFYFNSLNQKTKNCIARIEEVNFNDGRKAFLFFESNASEVTTPVEAEQLANLLKSTQIPIVILNACQSAKQENTDTETSLGSVLSQYGVNLVLAMRYSVSVTAVEVFMKEFYQQLYSSINEQVSIEKAISIARLAISNNTKRKAAFNRKIDLDDWLLPVVYWNNHVEFQLRDFTSTEQLAFEAKTIIPFSIQQNLTYGFFGRDLDILKIEKALLTKNNILLLQGMGGSGKTTLLKYLGAWWLKTGFVEKVFYFGYNIKSYDLEEILVAITKSISSKKEYGKLSQLKVSKQQMLRQTIDIIRENRYVLIFDNTEVITGGKSIIKNRLQLNEQQRLQQFLKGLQGGQSFVLIGSRSSEEWLKSKIFDENIYNLFGLSREASTHLAANIISKIGIPIQYVVNDSNFQSLFYLSIGNPLSLQILLSLLSQRTAKEIINLTSKNTSSLDKYSSDIDLKYHRIFRSFNYIFESFDLNTQKVLLSLTPFTGAIPVIPEMINYFSTKLRTINYFKDIVFNFNLAIKTFIDKGIAQNIIKGSYTLLHLHPLFTQFLKQKLDDRKINGQELNWAYSEVLYFLTGDFYNVLIDTSSNIFTKEGVLSYLDFIIHHFEKALFIRLDTNLEHYNLLKLLDEYLYQKGLNENRIRLMNDILHRRETFNVELNKKFKKELFHTYDILGNAYYSQNIYDKAELVWIKTISFFDDEDFKLEEDDYARICQNLGVIYGIQNKLNNSEKYLLKALNIYIQKNNLTKQADISRNLGNVKMRKAEYDDAKNYFYKAMAIYEVNSNVISAARITYSLSEAFLAEKNIIKAKELCLDALKVFKLIQLKPLISKCFLNLGNIFFEEKDYLNAVSYYSKALFINEELNNELGQAKIFDNLGMLYTEKKEYELALNYHKKALAIFKTYNNYIHQIKTLGNIAEIFLLLDKSLQEVIEYYLQAISLCELIGDDENTLTLKLKIYDIYENNYLKYNFNLTSNILEEIKKTYIYIQNLNEIINKLLSEEKYAQFIEKIKEVLLDEQIAVIYRKNRILIPIIYFFYENNENENYEAIFKAIKNLAYSIFKNDERLNVFLNRL